VMLEWLLWPGVTLMATAALTSCLISVFSILLRKIRANQQSLPVDISPEDQPGGKFYFPAKAFWAAAITALILVVLAQVLIFEIPTWLAVLAFFLSFILAIVAGRVSGETGIPPIGALGKITQVCFGVLDPGNTTTNLMTANVTGGAAGQCSDMLHDLKTGKLIGANLRAQVIAQMFGILAGSISGCAAYLLLIPDPQTMLLTEDWPAPAVATWKAVAEVLAEGISTIPDGSRGAVLIALVIGFTLALLEATLPKKKRRFIPSASSLGFAFIIPPFISLAMFLGSMARIIAERVRPKWSSRYLIVIAAGLVAGESLAGVLEAIARFVGLL
ncbi:MAG: OPT/YSL family transporter, partial [Opitutales bacterium]